MEPMYRSSHIELYTVYNLNPQDHGDGHQRPGLRLNQGTQGPDYGPYKTPYSGSMSILAMSNIDRSSYVMYIYICI